MKIVMIICLMQISFSNIGYSQGQDAIWYFGDSAGINFNSGVAIAISNGNSYSDEAGSSVCDSQGNLLFYTGFDYYDNFYIWNKHHQVMVGSSNIASLNYYSTFTQGLLICSLPGDSNKYYLLTEYYHITMSIPYIDLNYQIIDMSLDSGRGAVISANINLCNNCILSEKMQVIRNANGRDWWLVVPYKPDITNGIPGYFITRLITPIGIDSAINQSIGPGFDRYGQLVFSPDGNQIIVADVSRGLNLYDFDRCTGLLSNWIELGYPPYMSTVSNGFYGCSFSPSGRYIYASRHDSVFQYDVLAPDVKASRVFLAKTGFISHYWLGQHKLGSEGKIYIANFDFNGGDTLGLDKFLNVINYPDSAGLACGLSFYSFSLGDRKSLAGMPNIPNYNLGAVVGSVCDSLTGINDTSEKNQFLVFPNPANEKITIHSMQKNKLKEIKILNLDGSILLTQKLNCEVEVRLNVQLIPNGIYFYLISTSDNGFRRGKICIMH